MLKRHQPRHVDRRARSFEQGEHDETSHKKNWREIYRQTKKAIGEDNLSIIAAGVAFYLLLGSVPALAALISIYGWVADSRQVEQQFSAMSQILPAEVSAQLTDQMKRIAANDSAAGIGAIIGTLVALWSATTATKALIKGLNIVYHEKEKRGFFKLTFVTLALTFGAVVLGIVAISAIVALPAILNLVGLHDPDKASLIANLVRWPLLAFLAIFGLTVLYRLGPSHTRPKWCCFTWGSFIAVALWVITSAAFSIYVANFGKYNQTYGSLGAVIVLLMWLYLSAFIVLLGAEINATSERTTAQHAS